MISLYSFPEIFRQLFFGGILMNFCAHCGAKVKEDMSFCPVCGHALEDCMPDFADSKKRESGFEAERAAVIPDIHEKPAESTTVKEDFENVSGSIPPEYVALPEVTVSAGTIVMGVIALVLGIICLSWTVASFKLTIDIFRENVIAHHRFFRTATSSVPGIIAIILSQKSIDNGYDSKITKAAEILGGIGAFFHMGVLFILIIDLFI